GCCPASSARRTASERKVLRTGSWSTRSSPDRGRSRGARYRRFCCRATTRRSPPGGRSNGRRRRGSGGRTSGRRISPTYRQRAIEAPRSRSMNIIQQLEREEAERLLAQRAVPEFQPGDTLRVNVRIKEGDRERVQAFEGVCIARAGAGLQENFTVRKISFGEGVERVFPVMSPMIESIEVKRRGVVRRAKLYYLRDRRGKSARIAERQTGRAPKEVVVPETGAAPAPEAASETEA